MLWDGRWTLIVTTLVFTAAAAAGAFLIPPKYEATVTMIPVADIDSSDRLSSLGGGVSQFGGLASLAGLGSTGGSFKAEAEATLQSEFLTTRYIKQNNLLPVLFRRQWDSSRLKWKSDDPKSIPTLWKGNRYFRNIRSVSDNARTGLISLTISWRNPDQAAKWANELVEMTNEYLRTRAVTEAERNIAFLEDQGKKVNIVSIQQAISSLTESQLKRVMLARGRDQYALKVLDPATVPEKPSFPLPLVWVPAGLFFGIFMGLLLTILRQKKTDALPLTPNAKSSAAA